MSVAIPACKFEEGEREAARGAIGDHVIGRRACGAFRGGLELKGVGQTWWTLLVILNTWNGGLGGMFQYQLKQINIGQQYILSIKIDLT